MKKLKNIFKKNNGPTPRSMQQIVENARELTLALGNETYIIEVKKKECERLTNLLLQVNNEAAERQRLDREAAEAAKKAEAKLAQDKAASQAPAQQAQGAN